MDLPGPGNRARLVRGGEASGHIILSDYATTGDGLMAALQALAALVKVGKPAAQAALKNDTSYVASECPLAAEHLLQVMEMTAGDAPPKPKRADHPIEILARAYGLVSEE